VHSREGATQIVNSQEYWDWRFESGDWVANGAREQTRSFAIAQTSLFPIGKDFQGTLLDFGCALGDAFPVYREKYPQATLVGVDFSMQAVERCRETYGKLATFFCASHEDCPHADVIVCSNVLEHLKDDLAVAKTLQERCRLLLIVVPYREQYLIAEHVRRYNRKYFRDLGCIKTEVFAARGWSQFGFRQHWWEIRIKNALRPFFGKRKLRRRLQILYVLKGKLSDGSQ
jgi:cyclopropane fatty-acyl-phospholipid synthase-like methyltransferase